MLAADYWYKNTNNFWLPVLFICSYLIIDSVSAYVKGLHEVFYIQSYKLFLPNNSNI